MESVISKSQPQFRNFFAWAKRGITGLDFLQPILDLAIRLWVANVFFKSGLTKIANFDTTVALFENEYQVPLLPPEIAAVFGTGGELFFPVLLALGLGGRFAAVALFVLNAVAVISYPDLSEAGRTEHFYWGFLLLITLFHGPGKLSVDHFIRRAFFAQKARADRR
jgi:putative oxidoreductase